MKMVGIIDYYINEWHADNYPAWLEEANRELGTDYQVKYVWAQEEVSPWNGRTTDQWCAQFGAQKCQSIRELCQKSDGVMILAPSDPDRHLAYAQEAFPYAKRLFIDKTFAPDLETAKRIFALGEQYKVPFFSTSALRYATELNDLGDCSALIVTGGGSNLNEYLVHLCEIAVKMMGFDRYRVQVIPQGEQRLIRCVGSEREFTLVYARPYAYTVCGQNRENGKYRSIKSPFFNGLLKDIVGFFESGSCPFDPRETLQVMALRDAILQADQTGTAVYSQRV